MSFNVGNKSVQREFKRFIGVASVEVLTFNPTQEELEKLYNTDSVREPVYIDKTPEGVERVKLVFYLQPNKLMHKEASTMILPVTFTITNQFVVGRNSGKHQVIDSYGRTGWVTKEQLDNHEIPTEYQKYKLLEDIKMAEFTLDCLGEACPVPLMKVQKQRQSKILLMGQSF